MNTEKWHQSQRGFFSGSLYELMKEDERIWVVTGDLGYGVLDKIRDEFPGRYLNCGASEQAMLGIAVGLALEGKIPFVYTITSFFLRSAETINLYLHHEQVPVKLVGSGRDQDYEHDGYSHDAKQAQEFINRMKITYYKPDTKEQVPGLVKDMLTDGGPSFISLRR